MKAAELKQDEIKSYNLDRLRELEVEIRRSLMDLRLEAIEGQGQQRKEKRKLRCNLARVLTRATQLRRAS